jgi:hypothetical protein
MSDPTDPGLEPATLAEAMEEFIADVRGWREALEWWTRVLEEEATPV